MKRNLKDLFKKAHKMTKEIVGQYGDIDYKGQFGLCLRELYSKKKDFSESCEIACETVTELDEQETICFSGKGEFDRDTLRKIAILNGHDVSTSVTKSTTLLVVGSLKNKSNKIKRAESLGIKIMSASQFVELMNGTVAIA